MKLLSIIGLICMGASVHAQTTPAPPYYQTPSPAFTTQNNGTPMVKSPVENNNPSVQASIPILNKPSALEADLAGNALPQPNRTIYNNVQQNTPAKNLATEGTANVPTAIAATSIASDTVLRAPQNVAEAVNASNVVKTTVIYNNTTGADVTRTVDKTSQATTKSGNTVPVKQTYISETVVNRFKTAYGDNLYDIRQVRYGTNNTIYIVRTVKEGFFTTVYLNEDGEIVRQ